MIDFSDVQQNWLTGNIKDYRDLILQKYWIPTTRPEKFLKSVEYAITRSDKCLGGNQNLMDELGDFCLRRAKDKSENYLTSYNYGDYSHTVVEKVLCTHKTKDDTCHTIEVYGAIGSMGEKFVEMYIDDECIGHGMIL